MPALVWKPRWRHLLSTLFTGASGRGSLDLQVLDDIMPVAPLYDATDTRNAWDRGEVLWAFGANVAASVGNSAFVTAWNPTPGWLTIIEQLVVVTNTAATFFKLEVLANGTGGTATAQVRDTRSITDNAGSGLTAPAVRFNSGVTGVAMGFGSGIIASAAYGTPAVFQGGWVLAPATGVGTAPSPVLRLSCNNPNQDCWFMVCGRDVPVDLDETR